MVIVVTAEWLNCILIFFFFISIFKIFYSVHVFKGGSDSTRLPKQRDCKKWEHHLTACPNGRVFFSDLRGPAVSPLWEIGLPLTSMEPIWATRISKITWVFPVRRYSLQPEKEIKCFSQSISPSPNLNHSNRATC